MKKKTALTKMHIAPSTVCYDAVAARDSNEVGLILAAVRKKNGYSLVAFSELLYNYGVDVSDRESANGKKENPSLKDIGYVLGVQPFDCTPFYNASLDFADKTVKNFNFLFSGAIFMLDSFVNENLFNQSI